MADLSRRLHYAPENNQVGDFYYFFYFLVINSLVALRVGSHFVHSLTVIVFCFSPVPD